MTFQTLDLKGSNFLNLLNEEELLIALTYIKGEAWLKHFSYSNILYTKATRVITNHTLIGEYCL